MYSQLPSDGASGVRSFKSIFAISVGLGLMVGGFVALAVFAPTLRDPNAGEATNLIALPAAQRPGFLQASRVPQYRFSPSFLQFMVNRRMQQQRVSANYVEEMVAQRYALGLFELAEEKKELESVKEEVEGISQTLTLVPDLGEMLSNPILPAEKKKALLDKIVADGTMNKMCNYLVDKQRINLLPEILGSFESFYNDKMGTEECTIKSACKLTDEQQFKIAQQVQKMTGAKSVKIRETIDPDLIGGFIVSYGKGNQVDLSVKGELDNIRAYLDKAASLTGDIEPVIID